MLQQINKEEKIKRGYRETHRAGNFKSSASKMVKARVNNVVFNVAGPVAPARITLVLSTLFPRLL